MLIFIFQGTEDAAAAAANAESNGEQKADDASAAAPVTNGTSEEVKTNGEQAPVATPEESVTPPSSNGDHKPIIEAAKETVNEVIVAASKSVDEKLNAVAKPEVNKNADEQDNLVPHTQAPLDTVVASNEQKHEHEQEHEHANIDTVQNKSVDIDTTTGSVGVVDCTNNSSNNDNDNIHSQSAPPLPVTPPPSQITVFAASAMSVENAVEDSIPQPIVPIIQSEIQVSVGDTIVVDDDDVAIVVDDKSAGVDTQSNDEQIPTQIESPIECEIAPAQAKPDAEIAETIAILDRVNLNESEQKPTESEVVVDEVVVADAGAGTMQESEPLPEPEPEPISADISSPLPQHSLDTLPSPQSLSSNITPPPNECGDDDESVTAELANELPPPPLVDDIALPVESNPTEIVEEQNELSGSVNETDDNLIKNGTHNGNHDDDLVLPPPPPATAETVDAEAEAQDSIIEQEIRHELKTNGTNGIHSNGSSNDHDEAANKITDKVITTIYENKRPTYSMH